MATTTSAPAHNAPGPRGVAALRFVLAMRTDNRDVYVDARRRYGPTFRAHLPGTGMPPFTVTTSPQGMRDVLSDRTAFSKANNPVYEQIAAAVGDGLLTSEGERWTAQRRTIQPLFTRRRVDRFASMFDEAAAATVAGWPTDGTIDLDEAMREVSIRSASTTMFGLDAVELVAPMVDDFVQLSGLVLQRALALRLPSIVPLPFPVPFVDLPHERRFRRLRRQVRTTAVDLVAQRNALGLEGDDLVGLFQRAVDPETGDRLSPDDVVEQALVFLLAGYETTSTALAFALWEVSSRPALQEALREEAREVLGDEPSCDSETANRLDLSRRTLQEALRLHSPAPVTGRFALRDTTVDGFRVREGEVALAAFQAMHVAPELWPDPDHFDPDRFLPTASADRDQYAYLPFGGGPRACIGSHFATLEASIALSRIVRERVLSGPPRRVRRHYGITMTAAEPVTVRVRAA